MVNKFNEMTVGEYLTDWEFLSCAISEHCKLYVEDGKIKEDKK